jgi:hypothetical protein
MTISTFNTTNRTVKELRFKIDDIRDIAKAEKAKTKLENDGFNLKSTKAGFNNSIMIYIKFNPIQSKCPCYSGEKCICV